MLRLRAALGARTSRHRSHFEYATGSFAQCLPTTSRASSHGRRLTRSASIKVPLSDGSVSETPTSSAYPESYHGLSAELRAPPAPEETESRVSGEAKNQHKASSRQSAAVPRTPGDARGAARGSVPSPQPYGDAAGLSPPLGR